MIRTAVISLLLCCLVQSFGGNPAPAAVIPAIPAIPAVAEPAGASAVSKCPPMALPRRGNQYCEIFAGQPNLSTGSVRATVWVSKYEGTEPCANFAALTTDQIKPVWDASFVQKNGPRIWLIDCVSAKDAMARFDSTFRQQAAKEIEGMEFAPQAQVEFSLQQFSGSSGGYSNNLVARSVILQWNKGSTVYELVSPEGITYTMQSLSQQVDPTMSEESLGSLATRLTMPSGWEYRVRLLEEDLVVVGNDKGEVNVISDDFRNSYSQHD